jgi:hypothetical protein
MLLEPPLIQDEIPFRYDNWRSIARLNEFLQNGTHMWDNISLSVLRISAHRNLILHPSFPHIVVHLINTSRSVKLIRNGSASRKEAGFGGGGTGQ